MLPLFETPKVMQRYCLILLAAILAIPTLMHAQLYKQRPENLNANSNWFFWSYMVDMKQEPLLATPLTTPSIISQPIPEIKSIYQRFENIVPVSDPITGDFLFLALKNEIFDKNFVHMPNGMSSADTFPYTYERTIAIAPVINNPGRYYYFNLAFDTSIGVSYSVIDMSLNEGKGDIDSSKKNIPLYINSTEIVDIVPGNNCDLWLITTGTNNLITIRNFYAININAAGVNATPVISTFPIEKQQNVCWDFQAAPDRNSIAYITTQLGIGDAPIQSSVNFLAFDPETGVIKKSDKPPLLFEGEGEIGNAVHGTYTPDSKYFIAYTYGGVSNTYNTIYNIEGHESKFYKYDLSVPQNNYSRTSFYIKQFWTPFSVYRHVIYLWPIYFFKPYKNDIFFNMPYPNEDMDPVVPDMFNLFPLDCASLGRFSSQSDNYSWENVSQSLALPLNKYAGFFRGCDVIYPYKDTVTSIALDSVLCYEHDAPFPVMTLKAKEGFNGYIWNDGTTGIQKTILEPGKYWVNYDASCNHRVDTFTVRYRSGEVVLPPDTVVCEQRFPFDISAMPVHQDNWVESYTWDDGSTAKTHTIYNPGTYIVSFQADGCIEYDTITVASQQCFCTVFLPNAFTPNSDGLNDFFKPSIAPGCVPNQYNFRIFNRWGQLVYSSFNEFDKGWDGTYKGSKADIGTYFYEVRFNTRYLDQPYVKKGELTLVR